MMEQTNPQQLGGHPKTKRLWKHSHFIDPEESPIKSTLCGKGGHNHRTCPNVPP